MLAYDHGQGATGFRVEADVDFPLGGLDAGLDVKVSLSKSGESQTYDQEYEARLVLGVPRQGGGDDTVRTLTFDIKDVQHAEFSAVCEDSKGVSFADLAGLLGVTDPPAFLAGPAVSGLTVGYASARKSIVLAAREKGGGSLVVSPAS
ncbi:hypothetical protein [Streptomyces sp. NBRC 110611]|uniref:hypothetical protein n=1 Tax=Streptomyces sp. NBRC 110611 TaxID=1621259 RepID=UPI0008345673|nr:hypothetical protein [Streptomyces sp. NBRC 110611]